MSRLAFLALSAFSLATQAPAQQIDCANPMTQTEMTGCAAMAWEAADEDLNLAWKLATAQAKRMDEQLAPGEVTTFGILRDAQRAWITFRDNACEAESHLARGGTMQPQIHYLCMERLTRQRTEDLRFFGELN